MIMLSRTRRLQTGVVLLLAAGVVVGATAPSSAGPMWPHDQGSTSHELASDAPRTGFHRHFWRGSQLSGAPAQDIESVAFADEAEAIQAYCRDRFKSYDPAAGNYLGYDGDEHACP